MTKSLRVGVLLPGARVPAWTARTLEALRASECASLVAAIATPVTARTPRPLERLYRALDARLFATPADAFEPRDVGPLVDGVPTLSLESASALALDALVDLGAGPPSAQARASARHGVFAAYVGADGSVGAREVLDGAAVTESGALQWRAGETQPRVWLRSIAATDPVSVRRSLSPVLFKTAAFPARAIAALARGESPPPGLAPPSAGGAAAITASRVARLGARIAARRLIHTLYARQWQIGWRTGGDELRDDGAHYARPPLDRFWADPFLVERGGSVFVFFEDAGFADGRGHIRWARLGPAGELAEQGSALAEPWHLSYPFLLEHGGELYMLPESAASQSVDLYRCVEFPARWERVARLLDGLLAYDATLHHDGERWWMFAIVESPGAGSCDELCLFFADDLLGPWRAHPRNPVKSDARSARPAGRLFRRDGAWIRPSQDCTVEYGRALRFQRIRRLDPEGYEEEEIAAIEPSEPRQIGIHTVNRARNVLAFDRRMLVPRLPFAR